MPTPQSPAVRRRLGPYSRTLRRGAIGILVDGRSERGRLIRDMERQLIEHVGGAPTITQRLLIDRAIKTRLQLDALDEKLAAGNWTPHDQRTFGGLQNAFRLALRELGLAPSASDPRAAGRAALDAPRRVEYIVVDPKTREPDKKPTAPAAVGYEVFRR